MMRFKWLSVLSLCGVMSTAWAGGNPAMLLDRVIFQVTASEWASTQTAKVCVNVNATLEASDLAKARNDILDNLNKIAKADWQITQFNRGQDRSGLEQLNVTAEARLPENALTNLYKQAEAVSKPGATYRINNIDFTPSPEEVSEVHTEVRQEIYQKVQAELAQLNKDFSEQNYTVHSIDFVTGIVPLPEGKRVYQAEMAMAVAAPVMSVGNRVEVTATVVAAANRQADSD